MEEIEIKYLDVDLEKIQQKLVAIDARKLSERILKQKVFDYPDLRLHHMGAWIRLRDDGGKLTLAFKQRLQLRDVSKGILNDGGMEEIEVGVEDFEKTAAILEKAGLIIKFYEEKKRISYKKGTTQFDIDIWPVLPPYLEIEAKSWKDIDSALEELELDPSKKRKLSAYQVFEEYGLNENDYKVLTFDKQVKQ